MQGAAASRAASTLSRTVATRTEQTSNDRRHALLPQESSERSRPARSGSTYRPGTPAGVPTEEDFLDLTGPGEAYASGIDGTGVLVGVIDTGIWPEHPSFADDGTLPDAPVLSGDSCQFGNTSANPNDKDVTCNDKLVGARDMTTTYRTVVGADPTSSSPRATTRATERTPRPRRPATPA